MNDDEEIKDIDEEVDADESDDFGDSGVPGKIQGKKKVKDDDLLSLDDLGDEEDEVLAEDAFDDQDLW